MVDCHHIKDEPAEGGERLRSAGRVAETISSQARRKTLKGLASNAPASWSSLIDGLLVVAEARADRLTEAPDVKRSTPNCREMR
jgi:hypothetical protein